MLWICDTREVFERLGNLAWSDWRGIALRLISGRKSPSILKLFRGGHLLSLPLIRPKNMSLESLKPGPTLRNPTVAAGSSLKEEVVCFKCRATPFEFDRQAKVYRRRLILVLELVLVSSRSLVHGERCRRRCSHFSVEGPAIEHLRGIVGV